MSSHHERSLPEWLHVGPAQRTHIPTTEDALIWRVWERLRTWDRRYAIVVDTLIAVGLFAVGGSWWMVAGGPRIAPAFVAALTLPLILRRRAPIMVFAVIAIVALIQWIISVPTLADAALLVALYSVAAESTWVQALAAAAALETGVLMATFRWTPTGSKFKSFVFLSGMAFAALMAGVVVRALRDQMAFLAERAERLERERDQQASLAAAAERARIAREMHDVVSHNIQVMVTLADAAGAARIANPERSAEAIQEVSGTGRQALIDMRRMLGVLRDGTPVELTGEAPLLAPQPGLAELDALVDRVRATGLAVSIETTGRPFDLTEAAELTVFRIVQEAMTNALKHAANPRSVGVAIAYDDPEVSVRITDDGDANTRLPVTATAGGGHGVVGMTERAAVFGGTLQAGPQAHGGWQVAATLRGCRAPANA